MGEVKQMPKDKTASHIKIDLAMKAEFLEKGFAGASIRSIGERAGMTSAALYRHYTNKEDMFSSLVEPLINDMDMWTKRHKSVKYSLVDSQADTGVFFGESFIDMITEVVLPQKDRLILLMNCSQGTKYENFLHDLVEKNQKDLTDALEYLRKHGYPAREMSEEEIHMLLSAYLTAIIEPIIHGYPQEKIKSYLLSVNEFFMPGWKNIMGSS